MTIDLLSAVQRRPSRRRRLRKSPQAGTGRRHDVEAPLGSEGTQERDPLAVRGPDRIDVAVTGREPAQTGAVQIHAEDSGAEAGEHDPPSVRRERRLGRRLAARRDLLQTGPVRPHPHQLDRPRVAARVRGEHDPASRARSAGSGLDGHDSHRGRTETRTQDRPTAEDHRSKQYHNVLRTSSEDTLHASSATAAHDDRDRPRARRSIAATSPDARARARRPRPRRPEPDRAASTRASRSARAGARRTRRRRSRRRRARSARGRSGASGRRRCGRGSAPTPVSTSTLRCSVRTIPGRNDVRERHRIVDRRAVPAVGALRGTA